MRLHSLKVGKEGTSMLVEGRARELEDGEGAGAELLGGRDTIL